MPEKLMTQLKTYTIIDVVDAGVVSKNNRFGSLVCMAILGKNKQRDKVRQWNNKKSSNGFKNMIHRLRTNERSNE
jgi:hypothetical protein